MKTTMMIILLILSQLTIAGPGDGTLPAIRAINIDFQEGQLQRDLRLPNCVNLGIKPSDLKAGGKEISKVLEFNSSHIKQEIKIRKNRGVMDLSVSTKDSHNRALGSSLISVSESEFHNSVQVSQGEIQQRIQINATNTGCISK